MRLLNLVAGLLLVSPVLYAQHSPGATSTPTPHHTTSSPGISNSSSSSSSGGAIHHTPSSAPSSSSSSGGSHSAGSSGGFGLSSRHEHERDSSRDAASAGRHDRGSSPADTSPAGRHSKDSAPPASSSRTDTSNVRRADLERDKSKGAQEPKAARVHDKEPTSDQAANSAHADNIKVARNPEDSPGDGDKHHGKCDKEPCTTLTPKPSPTPELSNADWRQGRCQTGPCEPCPQGTVQGKNGTCIAKAPALTCVPPMVRVGVSCAPAITRGQESGAAASHQQCGSFISQGNLIQTDLALAHEKVRSECSKSNTSVDCTFAKMHLTEVLGRCEILRTEAPINCRAAVPACI